MSFLPGNQASYSSDACSLRVEVGLYIHYIFTHSHRHSGLANGFHTFIHGYFHVHDEEKSCPRWI